MPRIVVKRNNRTYKEFLLRPFQSRVTVGSHSDNDLILADIGVREHHFAIYKKNSHYFLEPLDGVTTTTLNGKNVIASTQIKSGDVIEVGAHKLLFENELHEAHSVETADTVGYDDDLAESEVETETPEKDVATAKPKKEIVNKIDEMAAEEQPKKPAVETEEESSEPHFLIAIYGPYLGNVYQLNTVTTKIGRDRLLNDIVIDRTPSGKIDASISRRHATIVHSEGCYYILDKRSKTRTRINGKELIPDQVLQLYPNDEVEIVSDRKSTILRFCPKNRMNFSRPKKSGTWWLRNRHRVGLFFSVAVILILALVIFKFAKQLSIAQ
ncbi:MAG: FHA domain-containing protein, partial [Calditrichaeota bacterium]|nr:FHA domain-containing protein [Calditrichota bacterium]